MTGPLTGTEAFFSGRTTVVCKSPVTGGWNDANSGGFFGPELKKAGYDGVFVSGASDKPVYIWIKDGKAEIRDASASCGGWMPRRRRRRWRQQTGEPKVRAAVHRPVGREAVADRLRHERRPPGGRAAVVRARSWAPRS